MGIIPSNIYHFIEHPLNIELFRKKSKKKKGRDKPHQQE